MAEGLQRITWTGKTPFDVKTIKLESSGFMLNYTRPTAEVDLKKCSVRSFKYVTNWRYGGPMLDKRKEAITVRSNSPTSMAIDVGKLEPLRVYQIRLKGLTFTDGSPLANEVFYYTLNQLRAQ